MKEDIKKDSISYSSNRIECSNSEINVVIMKIVVSQEFAMLSFVAFDVDVLANHVVTKSTKFAKVLCFHLLVFQSSIVKLAQSRSTR